MDNNTNNNIGKAVQFFRKKKKLTQKELAEKINKAPYTIKRYEKKGKIPLEVLNDIALKLEVSIEQLLNTNPIIKYNDFKYDKTNKTNKTNKNTSDIKLTDIEYIYYEVREINSLMLALEEGIFGDNWNPKMYMDGYTHVWNMVDNVQGNLEKLVHRLENKSID